MTTWMCFNFDGSLKYRPEKVYILIKLIDSEMPVISIGIKSVLQSFFLLDLLEILVYRELETFDAVHRAL